jgi:hypothetical protein
MLYFDYFGRNLFEVEELIDKG